MSRVAARSVPDTVTFRHESLTCDDRVARLLALSAVLVDIRIHDLVLGYLAEPASD
jgi:hypothetical protein